MPHVLLNLHTTCTANHMNLRFLQRLGQALVIPALALVAALALGAVVMLLFGDDPVKAYQGLFAGAFGSARGWSTTIRKMVPLLLTGLAVAIPFRAGLFNIGASGLGCHRRKRSNRQRATPHS